MADHHSDKSLANITTVESLCPQCQENGWTKFLYTDIPHFKETLIAAFECPHCGYTNKDVTSARALNDFGIKWSLKVTSLKDLNRQIVKSESASLYIPELELEIPSTFSLKNMSLENNTEPRPLPLTTKSSLSTMEGLLHHISEDLSIGQQSRMATSPDIYEKIEQILSSLNLMAQGSLPFTLHIDDPSGNSYIESLATAEDNASQPFETFFLDDQLKLERYTRTQEQLGLMGFSTDTGAAQISPETGVEHSEEEDNEIYEFPGKCPSCTHACTTRMRPFCKTDYIKLDAIEFPKFCICRCLSCPVFYIYFSEIAIPYFKEVIIMATTCENCGYKSNEVKSGSAISTEGRKITLSITGVDDLSRDILKSETCSLEIPEIALRLNQGTLGGRFTTVEGLLTQVKDELEEKVPFAMGDSANADKKQTFKGLLVNLTLICEGQFPCTLILDDPLANSYVQNLCAPDQDPQLMTESYLRTWDQNEDLGLNDMRV